MSSKNLNKWQMKTSNHGSEITIQSYWPLLTAIGFEPISCFKSIFWLVYFFCWTAQMWKTFLNYKFNFLQLVPITHNSSVYVLVWNLNTKAKSFFDFHWYHCSNNKQLSGNQNVRRPPTTVLETDFFFKSWNTFCLKITDA